MVEIEQILESNEKYSNDFKYGTLSSSPTRKLAILACMDTRIIVENVLGLSVGEAHVIRNAGGIATDDAIRSLIISHELLGTNAFIVLNHTECGLLKSTDKELQKKLTEKYKSDASTMKFYFFPNLEQNVREQVNRIKSSPFLSPEISVVGFIYDVRTGKLIRVSD
ncbi:MAG TPA: carbonic anhydrase [Nitrososphaeraceae archaeon]|jgi:carbonic anhydrase